MPVRSYIPSKLTDEAPWIANFASYIDDNFAALTLGSSDNDAIQASCSAYADTFETSQSADTRTPTSIAAFIAQRTTTLNMIRLYAQIINNSGAVTDEQRAALQITIRKTTKTKIAAPLTWPVLTILAAFPLQHQLTYRDSSAPTVKVRSRPFGAAALQLFMHVGATPPADPADAKFVALYTRVPFVVDQDPANVGQTAYYYARWVTARGLEGPLVGPVSMTIAG